MGWGDQLSKCQETGLHMFDLVLCFDLFFYNKKKLNTFSLFKVYVCFKIKCLHLST